MVVVHPSGNDAPRRACWVYRLEPAGCLVRAAGCRILDALRNFLAGLAVLQSFLSGLRISWDLLKSRNRRCRERGRIGTVGPEGVAAEG